MKFLYRPIYLAVFLCFLGLNPAHAQVAGVTVSPSAPKPGQTITVSGPLKIGKTIERANIVYYLNNSSGNIARQTAKVDFTANVTKTVNATFTLASNVPAGSYSVSVQIFDAAFVESLKYTANYAVFNVTAVATLASCSFNGTSVASGSSIIAYQATSVAAGGTCVSQTRTCSNGTLSGSYAYSSCTVASAPAPTPVSGKIKWHPGHYILIDGSYRNEGRWQPLVDGIGNDPYIKGAVVNFRWKWLEPSKGVYDFSKVDAMLTRLKAQPLPKRLIIRVSIQAFNPSDPADACDSSLPVDMYQAKQYTLMLTGCTARIWQKDTMDRYLNLMRALAERYNGDAYIEGICAGGETAIGVKPGTDGYNGSDQTAQYKRMLVELRKSWPNTNVFVGTNYLPTDAQMEDLIKQAEISRVTIGGPDTLRREWVEITRERALQSDEIYRGERGSGRDYRGVIAFKNEIQDPDLDGGYFESRSTPAMLYDTAYNINKANYIVWTTQDYLGPPSSRYMTGIRPLITSVKGVTHTACPGSWNGACDSR